MLRKQTVRAASGCRESLAGGEHSDGIIGVDDALTITYAVSGAVSGETDPSTHRYYCLREGVTLGQTSLAVLNYLKAHPEKLDRIASQLVILALAEAFPCSGQ